MEHDEVNPDWPTNLITTYLKKDFNNFYTEHKFDGLTLWIDLWKKVASRDKKLTKAKETAENRKRKREDHTVSDLERSVKPKIDSSTNSTDKSPE